MIFAPGEGLYRGMEQVVARKVHNLEVVGSNPTPATMLQKHCNALTKKNRITWKEKNSYRKFKV